MNLRALVANFTDFIEFLADHFNGTAGHILVKASPLLAPLPSAIAIYAALVGHFGYAPAIIVTLVVEGLGFAAVDARNKIEAHNRAAPPALQQDNSKAQRAVSMYFIVSLTSILMFETAPAWARWTSGGADIATTLAHTAPLVFPFFSNIGASIYSLMDVLKMSDHAQATNAMLGALQGKLTELQAAHGAALAGQTKAEGLAKGLDAQLSEARTEYKVLMARFESLQQRFEDTKTAPISPSEPPKLEPGRLPADKRRPEVFKRLIQTSGKHQANFAQWGREFGVSDTVIRGDLEWLKTQGFWRNGDDWQPTHKGLQTFAKE